MFGIRRLLGILLLLVSAGSAVHAAETRIALIVQDDGSEAERAAAEGGYTETLVSEAERALKSREFLVVKTDAGAAPTAETPRWSIRVHCSLEDGLLSWWYELRDDEKGTLITADAFSAAAGLSVRDLLKESADSMIGHLDRYFSASDPEEPIDYRLKFISWDKGASVILGSSEGGGSVICVIDGKETEAEYIALVKGRPITIEVTKDGYWPVSLELPQGPTPEPIELPRLMGKTGKALILSWSPSRATGATFSYRYYPSPDAIFIRADLSPWKQYDGQDGSSAIYHLGARLGAGFFLPHRRTDNFRLGLAGGMELIWTKITDGGNLQKSSGMDLLIDPLAITIEFHLPRAALLVEQRFPFSLGQGTGFLDKGWVKTNALGMFHTSLGVMYKW